MASNEDEAGCVIFTWEIHNFGLLLSLEEGNLILYSTPIWKTEHTEKSVWRKLGIRSNSSRILVYLISATGCLHLDRCQLSLISSCMEVPLKLGYRDSEYWCYAVEKYAVFGEKRQSILPNDTLTLRCKMWEKTMRNREFRINSILYRFTYLWNIEKFNPACPYSSHIEDRNFLFKVSLRNIIGTDFNELIFGEVSSKECNVYPIKCKLSVKNGSVTVIEENMDDSYNKKVYKIDICVNNTRLDLQLESVFSVFKVCQDPFNLPSAPLSENVSEAVSGALGDHLLLLYIDKLFTDVTINTKGKSFNVHRSILSARSPVFRAMFEKDEMSEGRSGAVDIDDVDSDTVDRMLVFLYGDSLENVQQWEDASALYYAADKYDIQPLKHKCASSLKEGLTVDNACEALVLADRHTDDQLMKCTVDFICQNEDVISSKKWDNLQISNPMLSSKILREMYLKIKKQLKN